MLFITGPGTLKGKSFMVCYFNVLTGFPGLPVGPRLPWLPDGPCYKIKIYSP